MRRTRVIMSSALLHSVLSLTLIVTLLFVQSVAESSEVSVDTTDFDLSVRLLLDESDKDSLVIEVKLRNVSDKPFVVLFSFARPSLLIHLVENDSPQVQPSDIYFDDGWTWRGCSCVILKPSDFIGRRINLMREPYSFGEIQPGLYVVRVRYLAAIHTIIGSMRASGLSCALDECLRLCSGRILSTEVIAQSELFHWPISIN
jgi:hypothetical protein